MPWVLSTESIATAIEANGYDSPAWQAQDVFLSFREWFPDEAEVVELLWSADPEDVALAADDLREHPNRVSHALAYGLANPDMSPRIGALRRALQV